MEKRPPAPADVAVLLPKRPPAGFVFSCGFAAAGVPAGVVDPPKLKAVAPVFGAAGVDDPKAFVANIEGALSAGCSVAGAVPVSAAGLPKENEPVTGVVFPLAGFGAPKRPAPLVVVVAPNKPPPVLGASALAPNSPAPLGAAVALPNRDGAVVLVVVAASAGLPKEKAGAEVAPNTFLVSVPVAPAG